MWSKESDVWYSSQPHSHPLHFPETQLQPHCWRAPHALTCPCAFTWGSHPLQCSFPILTASQKPLSTHPTFTEHSLHPGYFAKDSELQSENTWSLFSQINLVVFKQVISSVKYPFTSVSPTSLIPSSIFTDFVHISGLQSVHIVSLITYIYTLAFYDQLWFQWGLDLILVLLCFPTKQNNA